MRNLKKILALVLALVMSLSLMATAGAASFPDVDESNPYATAIDVLDQLKVFQGFEDGTFKPTDTLNRAQAAVLVYRIATGDVEGKYVDNYTYMAQSKFTDLDGYTWAKGYINYCQNAKIVVGTSATTFNPGDKVTGYQLMVMLLRTLGYGAAGEFSDPKGWELETAKIAEREGILKNVTGGDFGAPAPRQMVAEILFQGLLTETVTYSALTSGGYTKTGETLGKKNLGLEKIEGIVVANEYANLDAGKTLGSGKTLLRTETKDYTLNVTSGLDEIGEYRYTYVVPAAGSRNSDLTCTGLFGDEANKTWEDTDGKKVTDSGIDTDSKTEKFVNFGDGTTYDTSNYRIKYVLTYDLANNKEYQDLVDNHDGHSNCTVTLYADDAPTTPITGTTPSIDKDHFATVEHVFKPKTTISATEMKVIESIFNDADTDGNDKDEANREFVKGEVYVGTQSYKDISDTISYDEFVETYIKTNENAIDVKENNKGNWLKVIDNNNDGVAEYVFKVVYTMAQIAKVKDTTVTLDVKNEDLVEKDIPNGINWTKIGTDDSTLNAVTSQSVNCNYDDPAAGDVVYYAVIDNKVQAYKAEVVSAVKIDKVNRNTLTATVGDTDYVQSEVHEHIMDAAYSEGVRNLVVSKVTYDLFLDRGGYLAAFVKSELGGNLVLLTDGWFMAQRGGDEYAAKVYNRETKEQDDTTIVSGGPLFIDNGGDNNRWKQLKVFGAQNNGIGIGELNADAGGTQKVKTIVAALDEDGNLLPVDSDSVYTRTTKRMVSVEGNKIVGEEYENGVAYATSRAADTAYNLYEDWDDGDSQAGAACEIRALTDTVYYYVYPVGNSYAVREYVGYDNLPSLTKADLAEIEDVYAVGTLNTRESDYHTNYYYTADVVVVEFKTYKAAAEAVFVYDFPVVANQTKSIIDDVQLIDSNGENKSVSVDLTNSEGFDKSYDPTDTKLQSGFLPGLYWMYETAEDGIYEIRAMRHDEINDTKFVVGQIATTKGTAAKAYTEVGLCAFEESNTIWRLDEQYSSTGHAVRYLAEDSKYYTLAYDWTSDSRDWASDLNESDWETTLAEGVDKISKKDIDKHTYADPFTGDPRDIEETSSWHNNNEVLMLTKSNGDIIWAVSFERLTTNDDGDEILSRAYGTWARCLPKYEAPETVALTVNAADNNTYDVKWNGGSATIDKATPVDLPVGDAENFVFTIAPQGGNSIGDVSLGDNATWLMVAKDVSEDGDGTLWRCELYRRNSKPVTQGIDAQVDVAVEVEVTVTSQAIVQAALDAYNAPDATEEAKAAALAELRKYTNNAEAVETVGKADGAAADAEKLAAAKTAMENAKTAAEAEGAGVAEEKAMYAAATAFAKAGGSAEDAVYTAIKAAATAKVNAVNEKAAATNTVAKWKDGAEALAALTDEAVTLAGLNAEATTTLDASKATLTKVTTALNAAKDLVAKAAVISADGSDIKGGATPAQKAEYTAAYTALESAAKAINSTYTMSEVAGWDGSDNTSGEDGTLGGTLNLDDVINLNAKVNPKDAKVKVEVATAKKNDATLESVAGRENEYILTLIGASAVAGDCDAGSELKTFVTVAAVDSSCDPSDWIDDAATATESVFTSEEIVATDAANGGKSVTIKITVKVMPAADKLAADKALAESKITRLEVSSNGQTTATQEALVDAVATAVGTLKYSVIAADSVKVELPEGTKFVVGNNYVDATVTLKLVLGEDEDAALTAENSVTVTVENVPVEVYVSSAAN